MAASSDFDFVGTELLRLASIERKTFRMSYFSMVDVSKKRASFT